MKRSNQQNLTFRAFGVPVAYAGLSGLCLPIVFAYLSYLLEQWPQLWLSVGRVVLVFQELVWPTSIMMLGTAAITGVWSTTLLYSASMNSILYVLMALLLVLGHKFSKLFYLPAVLVYVAIEIWLFTL